MVIMRILSFSLDKLVRGQPKNAIGRDKNLLDKKTIIKYSLSK